MNGSYDGVSDIAFEKRGDRTVLTNRYRSGNSRISALIPTEDDIPLYFSPSINPPPVATKKYKGISSSVGISAEILELPLL